MSHNLRIRVFVGYTDTVQPSGAPNPQGVCVDKELVLSRTGAVSGDATRISLLLDDAKRDVLQRLESLDVPA